jgi:hypothetical protein
MTSHISRSTYLYNHCYNECSYFLHTLAIALQYFITLIELGLAFTELGAWLYDAANYEPIAGTGKRST